MIIEKIIKIILKGTPHLTARLGVELQDYQQLTIECTGITVGIGIDAVRMLAGLYGLTVRYNRTGKFRSETGGGVCLEVGKMQNNSSES